MKSLLQLFSEKIITPETIDQLRVAGWYLRPLIEQEHQHAEQIAAVKAQEDRWADKFGGREAFGATRVSGVERTVGDLPMPGSLTPVPKEMVTHLSEIFQERDLITAKHPEKPADKAMQEAIAIVRQRKEQPNGA